MNYGFLPSQFTPDQWTFGSQKLASRAIKIDGQWDANLPKDEFQSYKAFDTQACVSYSTLNAFEILMEAKKYKKNGNFSDRYLAKLSGTTIRGNNPHHVLETMRMYSGAIPEKEHPFFGGSWDEYYSPITFNQRLQGISWLKEWEIGHDWVIHGSTPIELQRANLKEALMYSPLLVAVHAWEQEDGIYIRPKGALSNHQCTMYGYQENRYWKIFDHYDKTKKKLAWDYGFDSVKRISIEPRKSIDTKFLVRAVRAALNLY